MSYIKSVSIGIIHLSLCSLPLRSLRTLRFNHSNASGIDISVDSDWTMFSISIAVLLAGYLIFEVGVQTPAGIIANIARCNLISVWH